MTDPKPKASIVLTVEQLQILFLETFDNALDDKVIVYEPDNFVDCPPYVIHCDC